MSIFDFGLNKAALGGGTLALVLGLACSPSQAARDDDLPGVGSTAHYVRLTGHDKGKLPHQILVSLRESCVAINQGLNRPVAPLPPGGIPKTVVRAEREIFYSPNRVLLEEKGEGHDIDSSDCSLKARPFHRLLLNSTAGTCEADLVKKEAKGQCDARAHAMAPADTNDPRAPADYSKVPAHLRHTIPQMEAMRQQGLDSVGARTGATEVHAGVPCEVYRAEAAKSEHCLARPASAVAGVQTAYRMRAIHGRFGLWLRETPDEEGMSLLAQEVRLDIPVTKDMFNIPAGLKIKEFSLPRPAIVPVPAEVPVRR